jgi:hypothetical protein
MRFRCLIIGARHLPRGNRSPAKDAECAKSLAFLPEVAWPDFRFSWSLLRKVQYGYCLLPHEARQEVVAEIPPSTLPGLTPRNKSSRSLLATCPAYRAIFPACAQAFNLEMIL